jgi:hypothetical protein
MAEPIDILTQLFAASRRRKLRVSVAGLELYADPVTLADQMHFAQYVGKMDRFAAEVVIRKALKADGTPAFNANALPVLMNAVGAKLLHELSDQIIDEGPGAAAQGEPLQGPEDKSSEPSSPPLTPGESPRPTP